METIWIRGEEWIWISDVKEEIILRSLPLRPIRWQKIRTRTKVVPFVPPDDEAGYEADDEAYDKAGVKWCEEVGYKAADEADEEADVKSGDVVDDGLGEYERCGRICCFTFFRRRRRPREQVAEEPGRRYRGILGALRSWFDRRRGR
ncbi:hypothetical protein FKM82_021184 [Ascaphus truei]